MAADFTKSFLVQGDINQVFDVIAQHFISREYSMDNSMKPNQINFSKKGSLFTMDYFKLPQTLIVNMNKNDTGIMVQVHATITGVAKTARDQPKWEVGINALENLIKSTVPQATSSMPPQSATSQCLKCNKAVSPDFAVCPYCSASLKTTNTCSGCNKELQPEFAVCPYCGKSRN